MSNNVFVSMTLDEAKELRDFISGNFTDCYSTIDENPALVTVWVKLREEILAKERETNG